MKTMLKPLVATGILVSFLLPLTACEQQSTSVPSNPQEAATTDIDANEEPFLAPQACEGVPPAGDLIPERIEAANTTRTEPGLYEGPVWINDSLYFSDFVFSEGFPSRIQKLDASGVVTTALEDSGSNGLAVDNEGLLIAATHKYKSVVRYNLRTGERTSVAETFEDNVFNSPNDLALTTSGVLYFTDPDFQTAAAPGGQPKTRVYSVDTDGSVSVVDDTLANPNGVTLSPNEDVLYVNGGGEQGVLRAYPIVDGAPRAGEDLVTDLHVPDGMAVDCLGNIYVTEHLSRQLRVFTPEGEQIAQARVDANLTNVAFGGPEGTTLYLTGAGALWKIDLAITGSSY